MERSEGLEHTQKSNDNGHRIHSCDKGAFERLLFFLEERWSCKQQSTEDDRAGYAIEAKKLLYLNNLFQNLRGLSTKEAPQFQGGTVAISHAWRVTALIQAGWYP